MHTPAASAWTHRRLFVLLGLLLVGTVDGALLGCSRQAEGDRCSLLNGDSDCEGSLKCTDAASLRNSTIDRCCPEDLSSFTNSLCAPRTGTAGDGDGDGDGPGGASGDGDGSPGGAGGMGSDSSGLPVNSACIFRSDCEDGLYCISGVCRIEQCNEDVDCAQFGMNTCTIDAVCINE